MTAQIADRGGAPVCRMDDLPPPEAEAISLLRHWESGGESALRLLLSRRMASAPAAQAVRAFAAMATVLGRYGRRPLMRHHADCPCVGGDEACFATLVSAAADGSREDAMMLACLMVRADFSPALVSLAEQLGLALRCGGSTRPPRSLH